jgi:hypothetical protein
VKLATEVYGVINGIVRRTYKDLSVGDVPTFVDIAEVDTVYRFSSDLREKGRKTVV